MIEAELQREVQAAADLRGLLWHHCPHAELCKGKRGFPDLIIAGPRGLLVAELKSATGETTVEQDAWGWTIVKPAVPPRYRLWNPRHWEEAVIHRELDSIA